MKVGLDTRMLGIAGIGRFAQGLWQGLLELGVDVVGLGAPARTEWLGDVALAPAAAPVNLAARPHRLREQISLPVAFRREGIDVYHSPHLTVPYLSRIPVVLTVHDLFPLRAKSNARSRFAAAYMRAVLPAAMRRADVLAANSEQTADELRARFPALAHKVTTIDLGIDHARWQAAAPAEVERVRAAHRLPERYFLYVGTAKSHKNVGTLLAASDTDGRELVIAGASAAEVGHVPPGVRVLGRVPDSDLPALYTGATALLQPSKAEGVGFTVLEAMACGTPVIASATGGLERTVGDAALLADPDDVLAWRGAMARILAEDDLRNSLVASGHRRVATRQWTDTARGYLAVYEQVFTDLSRPA